MLGADMKPEIHLFIIWEHASHKKVEIMRDMQTRFSVLSVFNISWSSTYFSNNLSRFYGQKLPDGSNKELHCGNGPFTLVIVRDEHPNYEERPTSRGPETVNATMFDAKALYRSWTGGGHKIHATNSPKELSHDLALLLGKTSADFLDTPIWDGQERSLQQDLVGFEGWESLEQLLFILDQTVDYVVLRNFECMPASYHLASHGDIDLLTNDYTDLRYITNAKKVFNRHHRVHHHVIIAREKIPFDFRFVGDNYYDEQWQKDILSRRIRAEGNFWRPNLQDYFYSLLYHAAVHKRVMAEDYIERLDRMAKLLNLSLDKEHLRDTATVQKLLADFLHTHGYTLTEPKDLSVHLNETFASELDMSLERKLLLSYRKAKTLLKPLKRLLERPSL